jgi:hypothetical protein
LQVATCSWIYDVSFAPEFILSQLCKFLAHWWVCSSLLACLIGSLMHICHLLDNSELKPVLSVVSWMILTTS